MTTNRDIDRISNELEFSLYSIEAGQVIKASDLPVVHEVNPRDVIELNVSLARDIKELNEKAAYSVNRLLLEVEDMGGKLYGGSALLEDTTSLEPMRHRTTSLSEACARGFMDITSQQIVLGVTDEDLGFELYRFFRNINPIFLALTASSPYIYRNGSLEDARKASRRVDQYEKLCRYFPHSMWKEMPELDSLQEYFERLRAVSEEVKERLRNGEMDANWGELTKVRNNGKADFSYYPFDMLEPHQIYWFVRVRPDHRNIKNGGSSLFSLELRLPDMPATIQRIQMLNYFVCGLAYYIADNGSSEILHPFNGSFGDLQAAATNGLNAEINGVQVKRAVEGVTRYAVRGLERRGYSPGECAKFVGMIEHTLTYGNDADLIRRQGFNDPPELRGYLINRLRKGE